MPLNDLEVTQVVAGLAHNMVLGFKVGTNAFAHLSQADRDHFLGEIRDAIHQYDAMLSNVPGAADLLHALQEVAAAGELGAHVPSPAGEQKAAGASIVSARAMAVPVAGAGGATTGQVIAAAVRRGIAGTPQVVARRARREGDEV